MLVEFQNKNFIGRDFVQAALMSAGRYRGSMFRVWADGKEALIAADSGDAAHVIFNVTFKRGSRGVAFQRVE